MSAIQDEKFILRNLALAGQTAEETTRGFIEP